MEIRLFVGTADKLFNDNGNPITTRFHLLLDSLKIPHTYDIVDGAGHDPMEIFSPCNQEYDTDFWVEAFYQSN